MALLNEEIAKILGCRVKDLRDRLNHPNNRAKVEKELFGKTMQTTYKDRNGFMQTIVFGGISDKGATETMAYGKLRSPFNCSVATHFYARHRIRLEHPYTHCIVERHVNGEHRYYPLELVRLVPTIPNEELDIDDETDDMEWGRNMLSQTPW